MSKRVLNILVVEDDEIDYLAVRRHLSWARDVEFHLTRANGYDEALIAAQSEQFDIALIDYELGGRTGEELLQTLGGRSAPFPAIILTGHDIVLANADGPIEGAFDFIEKTALTQQLLQRAIFYAIENYHVEQGLEVSRNRARHLARLHRDLLALGTATLLPTVRRLARGQAADEVALRRQALFLEAIAAFVSQEEDGKTSSEGGQAASSLSRIMAGLNDMTHSVEMTIACDFSALGKAPLPLGKDVVEKILTGLFCLVLAEGHSHFAVTAKPEDGTLALTATGAGNALAEDADKTPLVETIAEQLGIVMGATVSCVIEDEKRTYRVVMDLSHHTMHPQQKNRAC